MSEIKIHRSHSMPLDKARKEAEKIARQLQEKFDLAYRWSEDRICFERSGVSGFLDVGTDAIRLEAKLGMLLSFMQPTIEAHITDNLDKVFGAHSSAVKSTAKRVSKPVPKAAASKPASAGKSAKKRPTR